MSPRGTKYFLLLGMQLRNPTRSITRIDTRHGVHNKDFKGTKVVLKKKLIRQGCCIQPPILLFWFIICET